MRVALGCLLLALVVQSAEGQPLPGKRACHGIRRRVTQANEFLAASAFDQAIAEYERIMLDCADNPRTRILAFSLGLAYMRRGSAATMASLTPEARVADLRAIEDLRAAQTFFKKALDAHLDEKDAAEARAYLARLATEIPTRMAAADKARDDMLAAQQARADLDAANERRARSDHRAARRRKRLRVAAYASFAGTVAASSAALYYGYRANALSDELSKVDRWTDVEAAKVGEGERAERLSIYLGVAAGATAISTAVLFWLSHDSSRSYEPSIALRDNSAAFAISGAF